jgi:DnaK suppressor protein
MEDRDLDAAERDVDDVERALNRLDDGTYGTCEVCGATIPEDVLADEPARRTCAAHG